MKRSRTSVKTSPARIRATERAAEALRLRAAGLTFDGIAAALGYRGRQGAADAVTRGLRATLQEPADELRRLDTLRLDMLLGACWPKAMQGLMDAVLVCLRILERRSRLLGLDAPTKAEAKVDANTACGVLVVPGIMEHDAWQAAALAHQEHLEKAEASVRVTGGGPKTSAD